MASAVSPLRSVRARPRGDAAAPRAGTTHAYALAAARLRAMKIAPPLFRSILRRPAKHVVSDGFALNAQSVRHGAEKAGAHHHHAMAMAANSCAIACVVSARGPFCSVAVPRLPIQNA